MSNYSVHLISLSELDIHVYVRPFSYSENCSGARNFLSGIITFLTKMKTCMMSLSELDIHVYVRPFSYSENCSGARNILSGISHFLRRWRHVWWTGFKNTFDALSWLSFGRGWLSCNSTVTFNDIEWLDQNWSFHKRSLKVQIRFQFDLRGNGCYQKLVWWYNVLSACPKSRIPKVVLLYKLF